MYEQDAHTVRYLVPSYMKITNECTYRACSKHNTKPVHVISGKKKKLNVNYLQKRFA